MQLNKKLIQKLKESTGAGIMDCKKALEKYENDFNKAQHYLKEKEIVKIEKRKDKKTQEGIVYGYIHNDNKLGVLVEINCETDFVARTNEFVKLAKELALQIAAMNPKWITRENVPSDIIEKEKNLYTQKAKEEGKPDNIIEKVVSGRLEKFFSEVCLTEQPYIRDENKKVKDIINETIAKLGENIRVSKFYRIKIGE